MKKGFTFIEVLAVILILGFLSLIVTPIIINVIDDSKEKTMLNSVKLYVNQVNNKLMELKLESLDKNIEAIADGAYSIMPNGNICIGFKDKQECRGYELDLKVSKSKPVCGVINIKNNKIKSIDSIQMEDFNNPVVVLNNNGEYTMPEDAICLSIPPDSCFAIDNSSGTITGYNDTDANGNVCTRMLIIPDKIDGIYVTEIQQNAFKGKNITGVKIFGNVKEIGSFAFQSNPLNEIILEEGIEYIGYMAFGNAEAYDSKPNISFDNLSINKLYIPNSVNEIEIAAFFQLKIKELVIGSGVKTIGQSSFQGSDVEKLAFESGSVLETIGNYAFRGNNLTKLILPNTVKTIGNFAFQGNNFTELIIPDSVEIIGDSAFSHIPIQTLTLGSGLKEIGSAAFSQSVTQGRCNLRTINIKMNESSFDSISKPGNWYINDDVYCHKNYPITFNYDYEG